MVEFTPSNRSMGTNRAQEISCGGAFFLRPFPSSDRSITASGLQSLESGQGC